jgi:hypothetical protein
MNSPRILKNVASVAEAVDFINSLSARYFKEFRRKETVSLCVSITSSLPPLGEKLLKPAEKVDVRLHWEPTDTQKQEAAWFVANAS